MGRCHDVIFGQDEDRVAGGGFGLEYGCAGTLDGVTVVPGRAEGVKEAGRCEFAKHAGDGRRGEGNEEWRGASNVLNGCGVGGQVAC
eukprot:4909143-Pleurochrysis_carterae.AAC.1